MVRYKHPKQLPQADLQRFLEAAEGLHKSIAQPLISPQCDHCRSMQSLHEALLRTVREVTGKEVAFIQWNGMGPVKKIGTWVTRLSP
ncbi:hypothetical protein NKH63_25855 [Mesorhizobium sp. M0960]